MRITNCGRGVHQSELVGIDKLEKLPPHWYAFTNLDVVLGPGRPREIDVIIIADDRLLLVDLKHYRGKIENSAGRWTHKGADRGPSPVAKISQNARDISTLLGSHLKKHAKGAKVTTPLIQGVVVITGGGDFSGVTGAEAASVFEVNDFIKRVSDSKERVRTFGAPHTSASDPITSGPWKHRLGGFFNTSGGAGVMRPGMRRYGNFVAASEASTFEHPAQIYAEYDVADEHAHHTLGTLRLWDFARAEARFQSEEGRAEIAGRERLITGFIADRSEACARRFLASLADDGERSVSYWEVYERRQRLRRLSDVAAKLLAEPVTVRLDLAKQLVSALSDLHLLDAAHLDLAGHSVWLEAPTTVRLSHLMAARLPEVKSLSASRYQFLSSSRAPEDGRSGDRIDAKRRDVYSLGLCVHQILFGTLPKNSEAGALAWAPEVDAAGEHSRLHEWFEKALAADPEQRFADASAALQLFNKATEARPTRQEVIEGLADFRQAWRSQGQLFAAYPASNFLRASDEVDIWRSVHNGEPALIKMWKAPAWGDATREGPRLLAFLELARDLKLSPQAGCVRVHEAAWLGDAIAVVLEWAIGSDLAQSLEDDPRWRDLQAGARFLIALCVLVEGLHERGRAHGDIKPQNIIVGETEDGAPRPTLVDFLDFSAEKDGDIITNAYAPAVGGRQERDRYGITCVAEDVLSRAEINEETKAILAKAIEECRQKEPKNGTLLPLAEALEEVCREPEIVRDLDLAFSARNCDVGEILSDEGKFFVRRGRYDQTFIVRGAVEEVAIDLDAAGEPIYAARRRLDQRRIGPVRQREFFSFPGSMRIVDGSINALSPLRALFQDEGFQNALAHEAPLEGGVTEGAEEEQIQEEPESDASEDRLAEEIVAERVVASQPALQPVDVKRLWKGLMDTENAMANEAIVLDDSYYDRRLKRHVVAIDLVSGALEFDRKQGDRVVVQREERQSWRQVGELDLQRLDRDQVLIDADRITGTIARRNQRLRFVSNFEARSRERRKAAIDRLLAGAARIPELVEVFADQERMPEIVESAWREEDFKQYGLNDAQREALDSLLKVRPVGLVQGPPGTGKTVFIATLVHFALTHGLARNVLLASQSHEAVNTAAEEVLKLYQREGRTPSLLRVGVESVVSDALAPYHSQRVEQAMKDRFRAEMRERLALAARQLNIPDELVDEVIYVEMAVRPLAERASSLTDAIQKDRRQSVLWSLRNALERIGFEISADDLKDNFVVRKFMTEVFETLRRRSNGSTSSVSLERFSRVAQLASDFVGASSGGLRNFEPLLAGTREIVVGTCVGLGRPALGLTKTAFDLVIIDEAARCTAGELAVPMQAGRWVVLVGDHAQLEPHHPRTVVAQVARDTGISKGEVSRSDFERIYSRPYGRAAGRTLKTQYRMLPPIGRMVSTTFYKNKLTHGRTTPLIPTGAAPRHLEKAVAWLATDELGKRAEQKSRGPSLYNDAEISLILALLEAWQTHDPFVHWIESQKDHAHAIGVICTYASQRDRLRRRLDLSHLKAPLRTSIRVDTVDAYQGKQNPIVVLSLVRNNTDGPEEGGARTIVDGFLSRPHRINVAMSRAMDRLVIVGARSRWRAGGPMSELQAAFESECERGDAQLLRVKDILPDHDGESGRKGSKK